MMHRSFLLLTAALALLAACSSPEPKLFMLAEVAPAAAVAAPPSRGGPAIVLREVSLARYLDRPQIVRAVADNQVGVSQDDWWGEPLGRMIGRVLVADLAARLPGRTVIAETGAIGARPGDMVAEVNILDFAATAHDQVRLVAQVSVLPRDRAADRRVRSLDIAVPMAGKDAKAQVAAMSAALGQLADTLAELAGR